MPFAIPTAHRFGVDAKIAALVLLCNM